MRRVLPLLLLGACVDPRPYAQPPEITNHVSDWREEVIYQLMVDRFANGDRNNDWNVSLNPDALARYQGGDYQGVIDQIDYLEALGVTAVWVSPIVLNVEEDAGVSSYHGYWTQDFLSVNPHFGDLAKFREMVDLLHDRDIKVILDIVVNHVGQLFYYDINRNGQPDTTIFGAGSQDSSEEFFEDPIEVITEWDPAYDPTGVQGWTSLGFSGPAPIRFVNMPEINRVPPYPAEFANPDWYNRRGRVTDWNDDEQVLKGDFPGGLKDLDTSRPDVTRALVDVFRTWIGETNIDGYRIDTVKHVEHGFWKNFCGAMRDYCGEIGKEEFLQFGEVFDGRDDLIGSYSFEGELDSLFYFSHKFQVYDDIFKFGGPTRRAADLYAARAVNYGADPHPGGISVGPQQALIHFLDNHDIPRFLYDQPEPRALEAALVHLLTTDGVPCIYYGTEQGFSGGNDPANREPLWWSGFNTSGPYFQHIAVLTRLRRTYPALMKGDLSFTWVTDHVADESDAHVLAFERFLDDEGALVAVNTADGERQTSFEEQSMLTRFAPGTQLKVVFPLDDQRSFPVASDGSLRLPLAPYGALVLVPEDQVRDLVDRDTLP